MGMHWDGLQFRCEGELSPLGEDCREKEEHSWLEEVDCSQGGSGKQTMFY